MSHLTDAQLDLWLDSWAKWVSGGCSIAALGFKPQTIDQPFIQSNQSNHTLVLNHEIEQCIDSAVGNLALSNRTAADVGRFEYGALHDSYNPNYDQPPTIVIKAARLTGYYHKKGLLPRDQVINKAAYQRQLCKFREWMLASMGMRQSMLAA